jgi:hypothetical protein
MTAVTSSPARKPAISNAQVDLARLMAFLLLWHRRRTHRLEELLCHQQKKIPQNEKARRHAEMAPGLEKVGAI